MICVTMEAWDHSEFEQLKRCHQWKIHELHYGTNPAVDHSEDPYFHLLSVNLCQAQGENWTSVFLPGPHSYLKGNTTSL